MRARLLNLARQRGEDFQITLRNYLFERFLYRLGRSPRDVPGASIPAASGERLGRVHLRQGGPNAWAPRAAGLRRSL